MTDSTKKSATPHFHTGLTPEEKRKFLADQSMGNKMQSPLATSTPAPTKKRFAARRKSIENLLDVDPEAEIEMFAHQEGIGPKTPTTIAHEPLSNNLKRLYQEMDKLGYPTTNV